MDRSRQKWKLRMKYNEQVEDRKGRNGGSGGYVGEGRIMVNSDSVMGDMVVDAWQQGSMIGYGVKWSGDDMTADIER